MAMSVERLDAAYAAAENCRKAAERAQAWICIRSQFEPKEPIPAGETAEAATARRKARLASAALRKPVAEPIASAREAAFREVVRSESAEAVAELRSALAAFNAAADEEILTAVRLARGAVVLFEIDDDRRFSSAHAFAAGCCELFASLLERRGVSPLEIDHLRKWSKGRAGAINLGQLRVELEQEHGAARGASGPIPIKTGSPKAGRSTVRTRAKPRSTNNETLVQAALVKGHNLYADTPPNLEPLSLPQIVDLTDNKLSEFQVSRALKSLFGSHREYTQKMLRASDVVAVEGMFSKLSERRSAIDGVAG